MFINEENSNNIPCSNKIINCTMDGQVMVCHTWFVFVCVKEGISHSLVCLFRSLSQISKSLPQVMIIRKCSS